MATQERWFFPKEKLANTPSKKDGIDIRKELFYRQQAATLIQDMGQKLMVSQLCINSAIVYMHRFYMFHSFSKFHRNLMAPCCLFLACKVEEQPRKLEHLLKVGWSCMNKEAPQMDVKSERFKQLYDELVRNENILLATLGFDCSIDHPHTHVVKCCQLIKASRDLAQTSYFMATNSLHLTMMCLEYRSTLVACVCIYLVYKWSGHEIPKSSKGKDWFWYVDRDVTLEQLERVSEEFLLIFNQCPSKLKKKIMNSSRAISDQEAEQRKRQRTEAPPPPPPAAPPPAPTPAPAPSGSGCPPAAGPPAPGASSAALSRSAPPSDHGGGGRTSHPPHQSSTSQRQELHKIGLRAYKEKKEREHFKAEKKTHGERDRRPSRPQPPSKPESVRPGAAGDAPKPRPDALHKPSSVTDVRNLLKEVDSRHSLLHSVEHPAHRGAEPARPLQSRGHPGHARPHPSAPEKAPHGRPGQEAAAGHPPRHAPAGPAAPGKHRPDAEPVHKPTHHRRPVPAAAGAGTTSGPPLAKQMKFEKPPPPPPAALKQEKKSPAPSDLNGVTLPAAAKDPLSGGSSNNNLALTLKSIKEEFLPLGHPLVSPLLSPLFNETSPDLSEVIPDVLGNKPLLPKPDPEPPLSGGGGVSLPRRPLSGGGSVPKIETRLSPLCFTSPSSPKPSAPVVKPEPKPKPSPAAPNPPVEVKHKPKQLSPLKLPSNGGGSIFSPPPRAGHGHSSDPELVLPKVDDIPIFSPLKGGGTSSIKLPRAPLPSELRSVSISSHDSDFEVVELRDRPPDAGAEPAVAAPSALAADAGTAGAASAATAAPALAKVVSAPSSLLNAPIARDLFGDDAGRDDRHKHHKEKKKKKKEHKEHKEHKHKKEKKHKEHKEKRKDKHRDREEEVSKRTFTISKDKVGGCEPAPALEPGTAGSSLKLTIRPVVSPVSSPGSTLKFRIGKDTRVAPAEGFKKKRRRDSSGSDPGQLAASTHGSSGSKHKHKHKRHREDSECSDSQRL